MALQVQMKTGAEAKTLLRNQASDEFKKFLAIAAYLHVRFIARLFQSRDPASAEG